MLGLLLFAGLAWGFARVLDAPRWTGQAIVLVVVLIMLASQVALPPEAPFRQSVGGSIRALVVLAIAAIPFLGYRWLLRRLRARHVPPPTAAAPAVTGRVALVPEVEALGRDLAGSLQAETPERFGLVRRAPDGTLVGGAVVGIEAGLARIAPVWVSDVASGLVAELIDAASQEARARGAKALELETRDRAIAAAASEAGLSAAPCLADLHRLSRTFP
ncbi:hypothetical protein HMH01_00380 [Halovulum dunhuangense]|uniref:Uncharacterized protein n=1 Tax=Halovulum dunhuangense TaxID=1505036 RepID=A0A849L020_9RHOB|nr:hypothetical protein [Halovulum dunhuangense]NNU78880.1 hypothetical protein [Halovulum dunhuangense]